MKKAMINLNVMNMEIETIERYCHNCGKKVLFTDSLKRRQNANGKNLYNYAIFKCSNGHTWNKMLGIVNSKDGNTEKETPENEEFLCETSLEPISLHHYKKLGYEQIELIINSIAKKIRLDKLLSMYIKDLSRSQIQKLIENKKILVDDKITKIDLSVKSNQKLSILISYINL